MLFAVSLAALLVFAVGPAPAKRGEACTWGASSVVAEDVNGELVQSEPAISGCIP